MSLNMDSIIGLERLNIVAAILVVVVFWVIKSLVGDVPAYVGSVIGGWVKFSYMRRTKK